MRRREVQQTTTNGYFPNKDVGHLSKTTDCCSKALSFVPLAILVVLLLFVFVPYQMAVAYGHVEPICPYMSDVGTMTPEASYFTLLAFAVIILISLFGLIRYLQVKAICKNYQTKLSNQKRNRILKLNKYGLLSHGVFFVGVFCWGCFRISENPLIHSIFGLLPAIFGWIPIAIIQTKISNATYPFATNRWLLLIRKCLFVLFLICCVVCGVSLFWSVFAAKDRQQILSTEKRMKWKPEDGGYEMHALSAAMEWIGTLIWGLFVATFYFDFKKSKILDGDIQFEIQCCSKALPLVPLAVSLTTFLLPVVYPIAVANRHVEPIFPYFSDFSATPPEAGYFCLIALTLAMLIILNGLIRYRQVISICKTISVQQRDKLLKWNKYNLISYALTSVGTIAWACFRVSEWPLIHLIFSIIVGFLGWIPMTIFESKISTGTQPQAVSRRLAGIRKILMILFLIGCFVGGVSLVWSAVAAKDSQRFSDTHKRMKWKPEDGGYEMHVLSASMELFSIFVWAVFMSTYYFDFKKCKIVDGDIRFESYK